MSEPSEFAEVLRKCRRSHYHEVADVIEHFADHDVSQFGPVYKPASAPHKRRVDAFHVLWAFRAGRAFEVDGDE